MGKKLSEMTIEELWELFPIFLTEHQDCWAEWYEEEAGILRGILPPGHELHHVGSTAIKGIWAKPIVDILIEAPDMRALNTAGEALKAAGYICMSRGENRRQNPPSAGCTRPGRAHTPSRAPALNAHTPSLCPGAR